MTLEFQFDEFHGDGELVDIHTTIAVHIGQSPESDLRTNETNWLLLYVTFLNTGLTRSVPGQEGAVPTEGRSSWLDRLKRKYPKRKVGLSVL